MTTKKKPVSKKPAQNQKSKAAQEAVKKANSLKEKAETTKKEQDSSKSVEAAKSATLDPDSVFKINGKPQYWRNAVHVPGVGQVTGAVKVGHMHKFFAKAPKETDLTTWMSDVDLVEQRIESARAKMKQRAGQK